MKLSKRLITVGLCLCLLYLAKTAVGINLSQRYHAIDLVRVPAKFVVHQLNIWHEGSNHSS